MVATGRRSGGSGLWALNVTSGWFVAALALATVGLALVTAATWDWPRWRLPRRAVTLLLTQLMVLVTCGAWVNSQLEFYSTVGDLFGVGVSGGHGAGVPPETPTVGPTVSRAQRDRLAAWTAAARRRRGPGRGVVVPLVFAGVHSGHRLPGRVYLPDAYFAPRPASRPFPVLQLLAGYPGTVQSWTHTLGLADLLDRQIAAGRLPALVAVAAEQNPHRGRDSECVDGADGSRAETFLARDVPEILRGYLPVTADRAGWALMGYSTGGYGAVNLALRNPHRYAAAISLAGHFAPLSDHSTGNIYRGDERLRRANNPMATAGTGTGPPIQFYLFAGTDDGPAMAAIAGFAPRIAPPHTVTVAVGPGGHNFGVWQAALPDILAWLGSALRTP